MMIFSRNVREIKYNQHKKQENTKMYSTFSYIAFSLAGDALEEWSKYIIAFSILTFAYFFFQAFW